MPWDEEYKSMEAEIATLRAELDEAKITLRDQFAMAALTGQLASRHYHSDSKPNFSAGIAYRYADAMLAARALRDASEEGGEDG